MRKKKKFNKFINAVGIELEGLWRGVRFEESGYKRYKGYRIKTDGSVHIGNKLDGDFEGEINSNLIRSELELSKFLRIGYPIRSNETCGMHVHISFNKSTYYLALMDKTFWRVFCIEMEKLCRKMKNSRDITLFKNRLSGKNSYCRRNFSNKVVLHQFNNTGDKYSIINFCYRKYSTVEFRVFPMFSEPAVAFFVVTNLLSFITKYLAKRKVSNVKTINYSSE